MDNNTVCENINIDECKELFEYEMTEVIIKLKGGVCCGLRLQQAIQRGSCGRKQPQY